MIGLENALKISLQDVLKMSWRRLQNVLKTSWRCLEDVFARRLEDVLKTSWRRLEDVWPRRIYWSWPRRLEDVLKTSSEDVRLRRTYSSWSRRLEDVFWRRRRKTSSRRLHQDKYLLGNFCCCLDLYHITFYIMLYRENAKHLQIDWLKQRAIFTISTSLSLSSDH